MFDRSFMGIMIIAKRFDRLKKKTTGLDCFAPRFSTPVETSTRSEVVGRTAVSFVSITGRQ